MKYFLARCDACRWQEKHEEGKAARAALKAHLKEFHEGEEPSGEPGGVVAHIAEVDTDRR